MEEELIKYGLSEKEAKLYIICLKTGETTANRLIELSEFPRATVYDILNKLKTLGLITSFIKNKTTHFKANDPEILIKILDEKKSAIKRTIPKLKNIQGNIGQKAIIEVFEGFGGVKKILDEVLENAKEVIIMGNERKGREILYHHSENFKLRRIENKIKIKNLLESSEIAYSLKDDKYSEVRHLENLENSNIFLIIYNNIVAHIMMGEVITTIKVNSKEYAKDQKIIFEELWKIAKK